MTPTALINTVTKAVALDREIAEKQEALKELKAQLVLEAQTRADEHTPTEGGGAAWTATGRDGCIVRVAFPAPTLKASIQGDGAAFAKIKETAGSLFTRLFIPAVIYKPVAKFREEAAAILNATNARKLIKLCQSSTQPRVSFETKEAA